MADAVVAAMEARGVVAPVAAWVAVMQVDLAVLAARPEAGAQPVAPVADLA